MNERPTPPSVTVNYPQTGASTRSNEMGMRDMQERVYLKLGEQYFLIKSPVTNHVACRSVELKKERRGTASFE